MRGIPAAARIILPGLLITALGGCDETTEVPPIVLPPTDDGVITLDVGGDLALPGDAAMPDAAPTDGPIVDLPACLDPCDDGDALTTGDRCVDDVCVGEPLPPMLALVGDAAPLGADSAPAGEVLTLAVSGEALALTPTGARAPRALYTTDDGVWAARPLDLVDATPLARWDGERFAPLTHRAPLAPGARVVALPEGAAAIVGVGGLTSHVTAAGEVTPLGAGDADDRAFVGHTGARWEARTLDAAPGMPWALDVDGIDALDPDGIFATDGTREDDAIRVIAGHGFVRLEDGVVALDVARRRSAALELDALPTRASPDARWLAVAPGNALVDLANWPPVVHHAEAPWDDAVLLDGALVAVDADGGLWLGRLGPDSPAALEPIGAVDPGATLIAVGPDAVLTQGADGWTHIGAAGTLTPLPPLAARFVGAAAGRAWFVEPGRAAALALDALTVAALDDPRIGPALGVDGAIALVRASDPAPVTLVRRGPDGDTPLADVWIPEPVAGARGLEGDALGVLAAGDIVAYLPSADGHITAIDLAGDGEPVEVARLIRRPNWLDARITADGRWVVWRAGDALVGTLRGARTDGSDFPDGVPLWQSRAYPALVAPSGDRVTVAVETGPTIGIPVIELDRDEPEDEALFVRVDGQGTYPLAWLDAATFASAHCFGDGCAAWGLGTVTVDAAGFQLRALVGGDPNIRRPVWRQTAMTTPEDMWFVRDDARSTTVLRVALDGTGGWSNVTSTGPGAPVRLVGPVERGVLFELDAGRVWYAARSGGASEYTLPVDGGLAAFGPTGSGRPALVMAASEPGLGCVDCGAWRLERGGAPLRLGSDFDGPLRPHAFSPDGQAVIHHGLAPGGHLGVELTGAHADQRAPGPRDPAADVRFVGWLSE